MPYLFVIFGFFFPVWCVFPQCEFEDDFCEYLASYTSAVTHFFFVNVNKATDLKSLLKGPDRPDPRHCKIRFHERESRSNRIRPGFNFPPEISLISSSSRVSKSKTIKLPLPIGYHKEDKLYKFGHMKVSSSSSLRSLFPSKYFRTYTH